LAVSLHGIRTFDGLNRESADRPPGIPPEQPKNIVICADGTGNSAIKGCGTNVFKIYEAIDQAGRRLPPDLMF
jgi:uncharacterized protein (DUF2235 family)